MERHQQLSKEKENLPPAANEANPQQHLKHPRKLPLAKRVFTVTLEDDDEDACTFAVPEEQGLFSQALSGSMDLRSLEAPQLVLKIRWHHPEQLPPHRRIKSKPYAERNDRNDIRAVDAYLLKKTYEKQLPMRSEGETGCMRASGLQPDAGGYLRVCIGYRWFRFTHVVLAHLRHENVYEAAERLGRLPSEVDCSHRCGQSWCCNPDHLVFEPHDVNMERNRCRTTGRCHGHEPVCLASS